MQSRAISLSHHLRLRFTKFVSNADSSGIKDDCYASACRYWLAYLNNDSSEIQIIDYPEDLGLEFLQRTQILSLLQVRDKMVNTFSLISWLRKIVIRQEGIVL